MANTTSLSREAAMGALMKYNKDDFHIRHALIMEGVLRWFSKELGYADEEDFWGLVGLLHDIDFEEWPAEHCLKAPALLEEIGAEEALIHAVVSHGYGFTVDVAPEHEMEKALFATDELTGLIGAVAIMRPSGSVQDLEYKSVKKKFKTLNFAAGCSREVIERGAKMLGWELEELITRTILAMRTCE